MSEDTYIGNNPTTAANSKLFFHQYLIYDNLNWTADGYVCWDSVNKCFYVQPFVAAQTAAVKSAPAPVGLGKLKK